MVLYCRVSLNAFVESFRNTSGPDSFFTLPAKGLMHIVPQEEIEYGLSLFRESIGLYEERKGIPVEKSKKAMPFFRQDSRMLVGPEIGMYVIPLYEEPGEPAQSAEPSLVLELDYQSLGELCLFENYSLLSCKYEKVLYRYEHGNLIPYVPKSMPVDCLKRVYLEDFRRQPLLFGTLNGFLKSKGLPAEQLLNLS